ncbi:MAG: glycosyltransferase family 39 protein [Rhodobacteraceae bacterium]|nr:glycosyltransferase family 39 protein [Paracoccaceae bacterium]
MSQFFDRVDLALAALTLHRSVYPLMFVGLFALIVFLPGFFTLPPVDRDEARYAQATKQMVQSGDYVDIRLGEAPRYKKPAGIYWLQAAVVSAFGEQYLREIWAYRLPSLVSAVVGTLLTYLIALALVGAQPAFLAAWLTAACFVLAAEARIAKTDATLFAMILMAQWVLARLWAQGADAVCGAWPYLFWGALGASVMIKGPIGPMVIGLTVSGLVIARHSTGWLRALHPVRGLILCLALVLPWYILITVKGGSAFWDESLGRDLLGKIGEGQEHHGAPFGTHSLLVWLTFWPASIVLPFGLWYAWAARHDTAVVFCLMWIVPGWLVFELTATKLIHYVLPMVPALAILSAAGWLKRPTGRPGLAYRVALLPLLGIAFLFAAASAWMTVQAGAWPGPLWWLGGFVTLTGIWWVWASLRAGGHFSLFPGLGALALGLSLAFFAHLARLDYMWPSVALAEIQDAAPTCTNRAVAGVGYEEPSLMFLAEPVPLYPGLDAAVDMAHRSDCALIYIEARQKEAFDTAVADLFPEVLGQVRGYGLGRAQEVDVTVYWFGGTSP